jgi:hypothetical protein
VIIDVPTPDEFTERADSLLQLAYSIISKLYENQREDWRLDADEEQLREYWRKCSPSLANALALLQQAHELFLKGRVATVSPYLLLAREPQHWPKKSLQDNISFSEFLTVGAAELPRLHDMVCTPRLDNKIRSFLNSIRERRNMFVHQGHAPTAKVAELFEAVLVTHKWAHPHQSWFQARREHLENDHLAALYSSDHVVANLHEEFAELLKELGPSAFKNLLGFDKKGLWFNCPICEVSIGDFGDAEATAQLFEDEQGSNIQCLVCEGSTKVVRRKCYNPDCKSTVYIAPEGEWEEACCLCGADENYETRKAEQERLFGVRQTWTLPPVDPFPDTK